MRHLYSETGWGHHEIQESKIGFVVPGNFVLLCKPRDDCVVTLQVSIILVPTSPRVHFNDDGEGIDSLRNMQLFRNTDMTPRVDSQGV